MQNDNHSVKTPIKVLFLSACSGRGGAGHSLFYLLKYVDRSCIDPLVVISSEGTIGPKFKSIGVKTIVCPRLKERFYEMRFKTHNFFTLTVSILLNIFDSLVFTYQLARIIKRENVDMVYSNQMMVKVFGAVTGFVKRRPVIWHCRTIYNNSIERFFYVTFGRLPNVRRIIAVSHAAAANYRALRHKVHVVANGVDVAEHDPAQIPRKLKSEFDIPSSAVIVGYVGRIVKWKGIDIFLKAAENVIHKRKDVVFTVVGGNPIGSTNDNLEHYRRKVAQNGLGKNILFTGFKKDIRPYLKEMDLVVVPSILPDPCPRSVLEAMAFGIPIVGSALGGIRETITDGQTGLLVHPQDVAHLTSRIQMLIDNTALRIQMGAQAKKEVANRYNAENVACRIQEIICNEMGLNNGCGDGRSPRNQSKSTALE